MVLLFMCYMGIHVPLNKVLFLGIQFSENLIVNFKNKRTAFENVVFRTFGQGTAINKWWTGDEVSRLQLAPATERSTS